MRSLLYIIVQKCLLGKNFIVKNHIYKDSYFFFCGKRSVFGEVFIDVNVKKDNLPMDFTWKEL